MKLLNQNTRIDTSSPKEDITSIFGIATTITTLWGC